MTDNTDTPRTPRALPTREQVYTAAQEAAIFPLNHRERTILDAVLALIDKENTMPDVLTVWDQVIDAWERDTNASLDMPARIVAIRRASDLKARIRAALGVARD